jgi:hypothetical protein
LIENNLFGTWINNNIELRKKDEVITLEYLSNVGIDGMKPHVHLCRFFARDGMGSGNNIPATIGEVYILSAKQWFLDLEDNIHSYDETLVDKFVAERKKKP